MHGRESARAEDKNLRKQPQRRRDTEQAKRLEEINRDFIKWLDNQTHGMSNVDYETLIDTLITEMQMGVLNPDERGQV